MERAITGYFDYIEDLIERENTFTMQEFAASVNEFLAFRRYQILSDNSKGTISHAEAEAKAAEEYEKFKKIQILLWCKMLLCVNSVQNFVKFVHSRSSWQKRHNLDLVLLVLVLLGPC